MATDGSLDAKFFNSRPIRGLKAGDNITITGSPISPTISSTGGGGIPEDLTFADIGGTATTTQIPNLPASKVTSGTFAIARIPTGTTSTTVALGNHTHDAGEITYGADSNVATALANALKEGDSGKRLVNFTVDNISLKNNFSYESNTSTSNSKTKIYFSDTNGILVETTNMYLDVKGELNIGYSETDQLSINRAVNFRGNLNFQGGAINNRMLWKNSAGEIRPISNHPDATDGALVLPKNAGTLALVEELPTGVPSGGTNTTFLRGDGTWVTPTNTTYPLIPEAEFNTGTANTSRTVSAVTLNRDIRAKIISYLLSLPNAGAGKVLTIDTAGTGFEWKTLA